MRGSCRLTWDSRLFYLLMGRPKVLPANRLRANTACTACRASKKRCSGTFPCSNCIHKGRSRSCVPFKSISDSGLRSGASPSTRQAIEGTPAWESSSINLQSPMAPQILDSTTDSQLQRTLEAGSRSPEATHRTHPRMLRNLQGERGKRLYKQRIQDENASNSTCLAVYVGKAASLSFLQLLRDTVTQHIGPSQFSHNFSEDMLETEAHHDPLNFSEESCSIEEKRRFIQIFYMVVRRFRSDDL